MIKKANELRAGDECQFADGTDIVSEVYIDPEGIWVHWDSGDMGYVSGEFNVIHSWGWY